MKESVSRVDYEDVYKHRFEVFKRACAMMDISRWDEAYHELWKLMGLCCMKKQEQFKQFIQKEE